MALTCISTLNNRLVCHIQNVTVGVKNALDFPKLVIHVIHPKIARTTLS